MLVAVVSGFLTVPLGDVRRLLCRDELGLLVLSPVELGRFLPDLLLGVAVGSAPPQLGSGLVGKLACPGRLGIPSRTRVGDLFEIRSALVEAFVERSEISQALSRLRPFLLGALRRRLELGSVEHELGVVVPGSEIGLA